MNVTFNYDCKLTRWLHKHEPKISKCQNHYVIVLESKALTYANKIRETCRFLLRSIPRCMEWTNEIDWWRIPLKRKFFTFFSSAAGAAAAAPPPAGAGAATDTGAAPPKEQES